MSVYGYCRLALADEQEMAQQRKYVADYCEANNLELDEYFCDNGASGNTINRDEFQMMFNKLKKGDIVITKDVARLTRNILEYETLQGCFDEIGVTLKIINQ